MKYWIAMAAVLFAGCFDEENEGAQEQVISTTVQGLIAFDQIAANIVDDPGAAGEALLDFIKLGPAAYQLVSPPFDIGPVMDETLPRTSPPAPVPDCLAQSGEPACETYSGGQCEAGGFTFSGIMSRRCSDCDDPRGFCSYGWAIPTLSYSSAAFTINLSTAGHWQGRVGEITPDLDVTFALRTADRLLAGSLSACACSPFTVVDSDTPSGKPRKLVNSSFLVTALLAQEDNRCALVEFDGEGNPTVSNSCACKTSDSLCQYFEITWLTGSCGDGYCAANENDITCPADCDGEKPRCGDGVCSPDENDGRCPPDCGTGTPECGDGRCELGESYETCPGDCFIE